MNTDLNFCRKCQNLTFIHLSENQKLIHYCHSCNESDEIKDEVVCISTLKFGDIDSSESINHNKYITHDITLPKIENNDKIKCPNKDCQIDPKDNKISYIKYDMTNIRYIYICDNCGQKWNNN